MYSKKWLIILIFVISCHSHQEINEFNGPPGNSSIISTTPATMIQCLNGGYLVNSGLDLNRDGVLQINEIQNTSVICNGEQGNSGAIGAVGPSGSNGHNSLINSIAVGNSICPTGGYMFTIGLDTNDDNILSFLETTASNIVCNGLVGPSGEAGTRGPAGTDSNVSAFLPVAAIQPCGPNSSSFKEVLLGMSGGYIFAEFTGSSSTNDVRNVFMPDGNYADTDASHCSFSVVTSGNGNRVVAWSGGSAVYISATQSWIVTY